MKGSRAQVTDSAPAPRLQICKWLQDPVNIRCIPGLLVYKLSPLTALFSFLEAVEDYKAPYNPQPRVLMEWMRVVQQMESRRYM